MCSILITPIGAAVRFGRDGIGATVVDSEQYLLTLMRYSEMNPVRAGMVVNPADYPCWSVVGVCRLRIGPGVAVGFLYTPRESNYPIESKQKPALWPVCGVRLPGLRGKKVSENFTLRPFRLP